MKNRFRTVYLLVTVLIGAAFGVAFLGYGQLYTLIGPLTAASARRGACWRDLVPAGDARGLIVRKPGAALLAEMIAAVLDAAGQPVGLGHRDLGPDAGRRGQLAFLLTRYRRFTLPVAILGGMLSALPEWGWEKFAYYQEMSWAYSGVMLGFFLLSGALLCGVLGWAATRALVSTGAVDSLAAGREHSRVAAA